jgi:hypothetical protein
LIKAVEASEIRQKMSQILISFVDGNLKELARQFDFGNVDACHLWTHLIACHRAICGPLRTNYMSYFLTIFEMIVTIYSTATQAITDPRLLALRAVPNSIIDLLEQVIYTMHETKLLKEQILPVCLGEVLEVFSTALPFAKSCSVLKLFGHLARRCPNEIHDSCERLFTRLVIPIRELCQSDFDGLEEFRLPFFDFLTALTRSGMEILLSLPSDEFQIFLECLQWGARHVDKDVSEKCTGALVFFVTGIQGKLNGDDLNNFVGEYLVPLFLFGMDLMTDTVHKYALDAQVNFIVTLVKLPGFNRLAQPILAAMIDQYPGREAGELGDFLERLFELALDQQAARRLCKDFIVTVRNVLSQDPDFRAAEKRKALEGLNQRLGTVPGIEVLHTDLDEIIREDDFDLIQCSDM